MSFHPAQTSSRSFLPAHLPVLDGLRGIAIALVLVHQFGGLETISGLTDYLLSYTIGIGWVGVQLFFVLSGFLITGILLDTQRADNYFSGFFARRALRIFPLYFATLILAFVVLPLIGFESRSLAQDRTTQVWLWTYLGNWATVLGEGSKTFPHYWSLSIEEQFYLLWPVLLWRRTAQSCFQLCIAVAAASLMTRCVVAWCGATDPDAFYYPTICRADALALGGAVAAAFRIQTWGAWIVRRRMQIVGATIATAVTGALVTHGFSIHEITGQTIGYTLVAILFALTIAVAVADDTVTDSGLSRILRWRPLRTLGKYSYAAYIFHKPLHDYIGKPLLAAMGCNLRVSPWQNLAYISVGMLVSFGMAFVSYHLFEIRFLEMKQRFSPTPATVGPATE